MNATASSRTSVVFGWTMIVMAVVVASFAAGCGQDREPQTVEIIVPAGAQDRLLAGESLDVMPSRLELRVGDTPLIRNDDDVAQSVGPFTVAAGDETRLTYGTAGRFEGFCPLSVGNRYEIVVED